MRDDKRLHEHPAGWPEAAKPRDAAGCRRPPRLIRPLANEHLSWRQELLSPAAVWKALGVTILLSLLSIADKAIERGATCCGA